MSGSRMGKKPRHNRPIDLRKWCAVFLDLSHCVEIIHVVLFGGREEWVDFLVGNLHVQLNWDRDMEADIH